MSAARIKGDRAAWVDVQLKLIVAALRRTREAQGLSQRQVADATGIHQGTISFIESGRQDPSLRVMLALADFYNLPITLWEASDANV